MLTFLYEVQSQMTHQVKKQLWYITWFRKKTEQQKWRLAVSCGFPSLTLVYLDRQSWSWKFWMFNGLSFFFF